MRPLTALPLMFAALAGAAAAWPAAAQVAPYPAYGQPYPAYGAPGYGAAYGAADRQRYEMERLRVQSQDAEAMARQQTQDTRLTLMELQAQRDASARASQPAYAPYTPLRSVEQERSARETATTRRETVTQGVGQIDRWLDRAPQ